MIPTKPDNVIWTDEQWKAIYEDGHNILVSAGAGSGKTAVLTERLKQKIILGNSLKNLIVLTFTKDASIEMKERLRKALNDAYIKETNQKVKEHLFNELNEIDEAHIQTFDSYTAFLVKKYHYLLGLKESVDMIDENYLNQQLKIIVDSLIEKEFSSGNMAIKKLCDIYTIKNADKISEFIISIVKKLELLVKRDEYLNEYISNYYSSTFCEKIYKDYFSEIDRILKIICSIWNKEYDLKSKKVKEYYGSCFDEIRFIINVCENSDIDVIEKYNYLKQRMPIKFPRAPKKDEDETLEIVISIRDKTKKYLKTLEDYLAWNNITDITKEFLSTKGTTEEIIKLVSNACKRIDQFKNNNQAYTFMDMAKFAIKLLMENKDICDEIKYSTNEILIDEYQDTSDVQEQLINLIANDNVYMVGDIKQSIYRFRNANPEIFKEKYDQYKNSHGGEVIDLMKNFRSRIEVITDINNLFENLMSKDYGGVNYPEGHKLVFGNQAYLESSSEKYHMVNLTYDKEKLESYSKIEAEAFIVGKDLLKRMKNEKILKNKTLVSPSFSDFAVLTNSTSAHKTYAKVFSFLGIPFTLSSKSSFIRSEEIYFIKAMLECSYSLVSNEYYEKHYQIALLSLLRSFAIRKTDDEIHLLFTHQMTLKELDNDLYEKMYKYALMMENASLSEIILTIYRDFDLYLKLVKLGNLEEREQKLMFFYQKAKEFQSYHIIDFLNYLDDISNNEKLDIEYNQKNSTNDAVSIITIHKSKGLEYPICYLVDLDHDFNLMDINSTFLFDLNYGVILPIFEEGLKSIVTKKLYRMNYLQAEVGEKIRLYYVAVTRAKEKLIFVSPNIKSNDEDLTDFVKEKFRSFYDFHNALYSVLSKYTYEIDLINLGLTKAYLHNVNNTKKIIQSELISNHNQYITIKDEKSDIIDKQYSKKIEKVLSTKEVMMMEKGTLFHKALEITDVINNINPYNDKLVEKFLNHPFITSKKIIKEYHEYSFVDKNNTHGIIDLILETDECIYIIDYKLKNINDEAYLSQLENYRLYLESLTNKKIYKYLYSLIDQNFVLIK